MRKTIDKLSGLGEVGAVLPLRIAAKRLGWDRKSIVNAKSRGLRSVRAGRYDITTSAWIEEYILKLESEKNAHDRLSD
jgi:hypothetical protein